MMCGLMRMTNDMRMKQQRYQMKMMLVKAWISLWHLVNSFSYSLPELNEVWRGHLEHQKSCRNLL